MPLAAATVAPFPYAPSRSRSLTRRFDQPCFLHAKERREKQRSQSIPIRLLSLRNVERFPGLESRNTDFLGGGGLSALLSSIGLDPVSLQLRMHLQMFGVDPPCI